MKHPTFPWGGGGGSCCRWTDRQTTGQTGHDRVTSRVAPCEQQGATKNKKIACTYFLRRSKRKLFRRSELLFSLSSWTNTRTWMSLTGRLIKMANLLQKTTQHTFSTPKQVNIASIFRPELQSLSTPVGTQYSMEKGMRQKRKIHHFSATSFLRIHRGSGSWNSSRDFPCYKAPFTQDAQCNASKWGLLSMGVFTLLESNIKGKTFQFACASHRASCLN